MPVILHTASGKWLTCLRHSDEFLSRRQDELIHMVALAIDKQTLAHRGRSLGLYDEAGGFTEKRPGRARPRSTSGTAGTPENIGEQDVRKMADLKYISYVAFCRVATATLQKAT